nr:hypothetical protein Iba_chr08bCG8440 [Ipomoea batatas]GMD28031.1 hypothetical protein Iba_chr08eCG3500 [Ipomoea batatas]
MPVQQNNPNSLVLKLAIGKLGHVDFAKIASKGIKQSTSNRITKMLLPRIELGTFNLVERSLKELTWR